MAGYTKAERLLNLLMALRSTRYAIDRGAIRAQVRGYDQDVPLENFNRMFERDKEELRRRGIQVKTVTDAGGVVVGYRVDPGNRLPELHLAADELAVLAVAVHLWGGAHLGPVARNALGKVEARLGWRVAGEPPQTDRPAVITDDPQLPDLTAAVTARQNVAFDYVRSGVGEPERRLVSPWGVVWWRAGWYLVGWDNDRRAVRVFRISRMNGPVVTVGEQGAFEVPTGFDPRGAVGDFHADRPGVAVVELADCRGASLRGGGRLVTHGPARVGWSTWEIPYREQPVMVSQLAGLGAAAIPREPAAVVAAVRTAWEGVLSAHGSKPARAGRPLPVASSGSPGQEQLGRMLALVPWLVANDGITVSAAASHFGITSDELRSDLASVITSGRDDWTLFDIQYWDDDGIIRVLDPLDLDTPLALAPDEALALGLALDALAALPGMADPVVLARVRAKLAGNSVITDETASVAFRVDVTDQIVTVLNKALAQGRPIDLTYVSATRDERTERVVDPIGLVVADGYPYLRAHCRRAGDVRTFRLDRIVSASLGAGAARPMPSVAGKDSTALLSVTETVTLDIAPAARALIERHRFTGAWQLPRGWVRANLPVADRAWLRALVLAHGGSVVVRKPADLAAQLVEDASSALAGLAS